MAIDTLRRVSSYSPPCAVKLISYTIVTFIYNSMNLSTANNNIHACGASRTLTTTAIMHDVEKCKCLGMSLVVVSPLHYTMQ